MISPPSSTSCMSILLLLFILCPAAVGAFPQTDFDQEFKGVIKTQGMWSYIFGRPKLETEKGCLCGEEEKLSRMVNVEFSRAKEEDVMNKRGNFLVSFFALRSGSKGRVYHATEYDAKSKQLLRCVALKVALPGYEQLLEEEADTLSRIWTMEPTPKNVIRLEGILNYTGYRDKLKEQRTAIAMELGAIDLFHFWHNNVFNSKDAKIYENITENVYLNMMEQICNGLLELHQKGFCSGDVQDVNIMVMKDPISLAQSSATDSGVSSSSSSSSSNTVTNNFENLEYKLIDLGGAGVANQLNTAHALSDFLRMIMNMLFDHPPIAKFRRLNLDGGYGLETEMLDISDPYKIPRMVFPHRLAKFYALLEKEFPRVFNIMKFAYEHLADETILKQLVTLIQAERKKNGAESESSGGHIGGAGGKKPRLHYRRRR